MSSHHDQRAATPGGGAGVPAWPDAKSEASFKAWEGRYEQASADYATSQLIGAPGTQQIHPAVQVILQVHDDMTKAEATLKQA